MPTRRTIILLKSVKKQRAKIAFKFKRACLFFLALLMLIPTTLNNGILSYADAPVVSISSSNVTATSASIKSYVNENKGIAISRVELQYKKSGGSYTTFATHYPADSDDREYNRTLNGLSPSTTYYIRARGVNVDGEAAYSIEKTFLTLSAGAANPYIGSVTVSPNTVVSGEAATITVTGMSNCGQIKYYAVDSYGTEELLATKTSPGSSNSYTANFYNVNIVKVRVRATGEAGSTSTYKDAAITVNSAVVVPSIISATVNTKSGNTSTDFIFTVVTNTAVTLVEFYSGTDSGQSLLGSKRVVTSETSTEKKWVTDSFKFSVGTSVVKIIAYNSAGASTTKYITGISVTDASTPIEVGTKRQAAVNRAYGWYNKTWTTTKSMTMWNTTKTVPAGSTVRGIPYTQFNCLYSIDSSLPGSGNYFGLSIENIYLSQTAYAPGVGANRTGPSYGAECVQLVYDAWYHGDSSIGKRGTNWTYLIEDNLDNNKVSKIRWADVLPGDALRIKGHIMLVVDVNKNSTPGNTTDDTFTVIEQTASNLGYSSGNIYMIGTRKYTYSYQYLIDKGYLPYKYNALEQNSDTPTGIVSITTPSDRAWLSPSNPGDVKWDSYSGASYYKYSIREVKYNAANDSYDNTNNLLTTSESGSDGYIGVKIASRSFSLNKSNNSNLKEYLKSEAAYKIWVGAFSDSGINIASKIIYVRMNAETQEKSAPPSLTAPYSLTGTKTVLDSGTFYINQYNSSYNVGSEGLSLIWSTSGATSYTVYVKALDGNPAPGNINEIGTHMLDRDNPTLNSNSVNIPYESLTDCYGGSYTDKWIKVVISANISGASTAAGWYYFKITSGHTHSFGEWVETTPASCMSEGLETRTCTYQGCGYEETQSIPKQEHSFGEWIETIPASCMSEGLETRTCTYPGCGYEETHQLSKSGHTSGQWKITKHATENESGKKTLYCSVCGEAIERQMIGRLSDWVTPFIDTDSDNWYYNAVRWANAMGLISGMTPDTFVPNDKITRGMLVTLIGRLEGVSNDAFPQNQSFSDVETGKWYSPHIAWAVENNIVGGYTDGTFMPDKVISRQEMAALLYNYSRFKGIDLTQNLNEAEFNTFTDKDTVAEWAKPQMLWAVSLGIINGFDNGNGTYSLNPEATATRAEVAQLLYNYCVVLSL